MMQNKTAAKQQTEQAKDCYLLPNDQRLIFISASEPHKFKVESSICYKNIIEISSQESGKFAQIAPKQLQLKYIRDFEQYQQYIIAKWRILDEYNQHQEQQLKDSASKALHAISVQFKNEQDCLEFRLNYLENHRQIMIGEQLSKMNAFFEEKCQAEIDFIETNMGGK